MKMELFECLVHPIAIYTQFVPNLLSGQKGKKKIFYFPFVRQQLLICSVLAGC